MSSQNIFKPIQVGSAQLRNRIGMSALTRNRAEATYPTELMKEYYEQRAIGGAGIIVTEGILICRQGTPWPNAPGLWDDKHVTGWKAVTDAVHGAGGKIYAQLWHAGRLSHPDTPEQKLAGEPVYAPSAIAAKSHVRFRQIPGEPGTVTPTAVDDPRILIDKYRHAAINAKRAGFDGVELMASSGVLPHQFLDYNSNQRTDEWGGSIENRSRFGISVLKTLKEVYGSDVGLKLNPGAGINDLGMPLQDTLDTFSYFITEADKLNLAYIALVRYNAVHDALVNGTARGTDHDVLESYRSYIKNSKLFLNSEVTPDEAEELISAGKIDGTFIGLRWATHPDLVKRIEQGIPLNNPPKMQLLQATASKEDYASGYTDYPTAAAAA
ncbi:N-ethylmaleimide reductase [Psilocybe cubensis]|uniref:NADH:flavin oxidoreductase/NADH oxidase N-terminal domain-containing protein n=2 Tax=Psilocybe cubensis TaxID=181762 RepID=A0A8H8CKJ3_PSICU|nr:N-ethylmaleimide reductase [Psilocybe cubensis]KAH9478468.1 N-ethylmaleimide reductase [Psilocybe cubensis]